MMPSPRCKARQGLSRFLDSSCSGRRLAAHAVVGNATGGV